MWKLLSGIALIVVLDLVFIWMMAAEPDSPEIARAIGPTAAIPVIHQQTTTDPVAIDDSTEPIDDVDQNSPAVRPMGIAQTRRSVSSAPPAEQNGSVSVTATATPAKLFEDRIIWIGRTEVPVKIDDREEAPVLAEPKQAEELSASIAEPKAVEKKKRSFQSKALGVIKKPYDWMRSVADKLY